MLEPALGKHARAVAAGLARQSLESVEVVGPEEALNGPVVRGDLDGLKAHFACLSPAERLQYAASLQGVIALAERSGRITSATARMIRHLADVHSGRGR